MDHESVQTWGGTIPSWDEFHNGDENRLSFFVADKGQHSFARTVEYKKKKITVFETPDIPNAKLRSALTGNYFMRDSEFTGRNFYYNLGSREQDYFFKAKMINGQTKKSLILFYQSPEEYERHQHLVLPDAIKEAWQEKYNCV